MTNNKNRIPKPEIFQCQQCGSSSFEDLSTKLIQCSHCGTQYKKRVGDPAVVIGKGAKIIVGKGANLEIEGDLEIQEGANLEIQGQVVIHDDDQDEDKQKH